MKYPFILFDLDGTLTDPALGITTCVQYALEKGGYPYGDNSEYLKWIGPPLVESFSKYCNADETEALKLVAYYRERFSTVGMFENAVYPGIAELLAELKAAGAKLAVATNKPTVYAEPILENFGILQYFDFVSGVTLDGAINDKATVVKNAIAALGADKDECVLIGDRDNDVIGANANGIDCVYVLYGYGSREEADAMKPAHIAADIGELRTILL